MMVMGKQTSVLSLKATPKTAKLVVRKVGSLMISIFSRETTIIVKVKLTLNNVSLHQQWDFFIHYHPHFYRKKYKIVIF